MRMSKEVGKQADWQTEAREAEGVQASSPMSEIPVMKVYNKPMGNKAVEDMVKSGKIIIKRNGGDWEVLGDEVKLNILLVRKFYTGFVPRINEFGDILKDENQHMIKDFYYTPEVDVFNKDNIAIGRQRKGGKREVLGKATKVDFEAYCREPKIEGQVNPLFKEVKTNQQTGERYTTSHMKLGYVIYAKDLDTGEVYKIIPGGSYGRFNDIQPGTFEELKAKAMTDYKELHGAPVINSFIETKVGVRAEGGFSFLDWKLAGFVVEDNREDVEKITGIVNDFNKSRFTGIDFDKPLQFLPYESNLALPEAIETNTGTDSNSEVSVEEIPF